ncbi:MAG: hypothetical protein G01um101466_115 [Parcubacteria group bacterium Gr01-1014_66]|nr:MAG: hypothetical protein G01um101466_115 [Parcubacteria group bacterium Gr01-1014_66]
MDRRFFLLLFILMMPVFVLANGSEGIFENPIGSNSFEALLQAVLKNLVRFASLIAIMAIIIVGFRWVIAAASGNPTKIESTKKMFWWVLIGTVLIVGATAITDAVINFAKNL